jgi:hypothetical protein
VPPAARFVGLINDDSGDVQRVHLGLLAVVDIPQEWEVSVRETERLEGSWTTEEALADEGVARRLEEWSVHALAGLGEVQKNHREGAKKQQPKDAKAAGRSTAQEPVLSSSS